MALLRRLVLIKYVCHFFSFPKESGQVVQKVMPIAAHF